MKNLIKCEDGIGKVQHELEKAQTMLEDLLGDFFGININCDNLKDKIIDNYQTANVRYNIIFDSVLNAIDGVEQINELLLAELNALRKQVRSA